MSAKKKSESKNPEESESLSLGIFEYTKSQLSRMTRADVDEAALALNINPRRFNNKHILISAIMLEVNQGMEQDAKTLNPQQLRFCELYASDREFFGNGTQSYIEAYDVDVSNPGSYAAARSSAYALLTNPDILKKVDDLMEAIVLNDTSVDRQLGFWIAQRADPGASMSAIKEYNKLKKRVDTGKNILNINPTQYNVSITDDRGQFLKGKYAEFLHEITVEPDTPEELAATRSVADYTK